MADEYYRYCNKCESKIVMHAFSEGECTVCKKEIQTSHTPCDQVCRECSLEKEMCMSCGNILRPIKLLKVDLKDEKIMIDEYNKNNSHQHTSVERLTFEEIKEKYGVDMYEKYFNRSMTSESDRFLEQVEGYLESVVRDKQHLEGLVLHFYHTLKSLEINSEGSQYEDRIKFILDMYVKTFNITAKRQEEI